MKRLVEYLLGGGTIMLVEIEEPDRGGLVKESLEGDVIVKSQLTFEKSMENVKPAAEFVIQQLRKMQDAPDEVQVSFGVKLSEDLGAVLSSSGAEANYTVTLKWAKEKELFRPLRKSNWETTVCQIV